MVEVEVAVAVVGPGGGKWRNRVEAAAAAGPWWCPSRYRLFQSAAPNGRSGTRGACSLNTP